jgi:NAD(P)-dependent dehydrogenase (short-subunit alcohol dehydrogenase family)
MEIKGMRLSGQICIVTGAGSGIGEACARLFVGEGATVFVTDIQEDRAKAVADVTDSDAVEKLVSEAVRRFGRLDVLVNNVGFTTPGFVAELSDEAWHRVLNGCLTSTFYGIRAALRPMRAQKSGSIINISSAAGIGGAPGLGAYGAAKAGVIALTQTVAIENFKRGVRANCVLPNAATKPLLRWFESSPSGQKARSSIEAYSRCGTPEEIASAVLFLASPDSAYVNGVILPVDGGLSSRVACVDAVIE